MADERPSVSSESATHSDKHINLSDLNNESNAQIDKNVDTGDMTFNMTNYHKDILKVSFLFLVYLSYLS